MSGELSFKYVLVLDFSMIIAEISVENPPKKINARAMYMPSVERKIADATAPKNITPDRMAKIVESLSAFDLNN